MPTHRCSDHTNQQLMEELARCSQSSGVLYDSTQYIECGDSQRDRSIDSDVEVRVLLGCRPLNGKTLCMGELSTRMREMQR